MTTGGYFTLMGISIVLKLLTSPGSKKSTSFELEAQKHERWREMIAVFRERTAESDAKRAAGEDFDLLHLSLS